MTTSPILNCLCQSSDLVKERTIHVSQRIWDHIAFYSKEIYSQPLDVKKLAVSLSLQSCDQDHSSLRNSFLVWARNPGHVSIISPDTECSSHQ